MDQNQAETFLVSQTKKRDGGITEQQAKVLLQIWKMHRTRVHESVLRSCVWNSRLRNISWRIDVKSRSRAVEQLNAATAVVELELENSNANSQVLESLSVLTDADWFAIRSFSTNYILWLVFPPHKVLVYLQPLLRNPPRKLPNWEKLCCR